ncbi:MAG: 16S rRNA (cytidine(1402)-2'-O)-methyltransferase [Syntrophobacteraceae bacterium]|nr:16S rRNA (cytidine(1402)-2'-O)-methyltransferase [Desulfobacteraceae bacterium]
MPSKHASETETKEGPGALLVVSTPIGNLSDITLRALETLRSVDCIAAEDTRHTRKLLSRYDIHSPLVSYHSHNATERGPELIRRIEAGERIALVTDAGTPGISDPGALLIERAVALNLDVSVIPGPTALVAALVASGLPPQPFAFLGFPPPRGATRRRFFADHAVMAMTLVLYESPRRLQKTLEAIRDAWGNRRIAVARELTKIHEEIFRGTVSEALGRFSEEARGELTLVVGGPDVEVQPGLDAEATDWREELKQVLREGGLSVKDAADLISRKHGLPRRLVYKEALEVRKA